MNLSEKIDGSRIFIQKPELSFRMAEKLFYLIDTSRETLLPWLGWVLNTKTPADSFVFLQETIQNWEKKQRFCYAIYLKEKTELIGVVSVLNVAYPHYRAEIGYWLGSSFIQKGYAKEAVLILEAALFQNGFNRIVIHTDILNKRSIALAQSLGYVHEGVLREEIYSTAIGRYRSLNVFSKLKKEYKEKKND